MFTCTVDLSAFYDCLALTRSELEDGLARAVRTAAHEGSMEAKRGPFKDQTGELRRNIRAEKLIEGPLRAQWKIVSPEPYSIFVEQGTQAHEIWPKAGHGLNGPLRNGQTRRASGKGPHEHIVGRGQFLRWKSGGKVHFARMVNHPGSRAFAFMGPAALKAERILYRELELMRDRLGTVWRQAA